VLFFFDSIISGCMLKSFSVSYVFVFSSYIMRMSSCFFQLYIIRMSSKYLNIQLFGISLRLGRVVYAVYIECILRLVSRK
jgi:hypothetical protein